MRDAPPPILRISMTVNLSGLAILIGLLTLLIVCFIMLIRIQMRIFFIGTCTEKIREDNRNLFDNRSRVIYILKRTLKIAPIKRKIDELKRKLEKAKRSKEKPEIPSSPKDLQGASSLEQHLRDVFEATLRRANLKPQQFWPEYHRELNMIKTLPSEEEMVRAVEALAEEIIPSDIKPPNSFIITTLSYRISRAPSLGLLDLYPSHTSTAPARRNVTSIELDLLWRAFINEVVFSRARARAITVLLFMRNMLMMGAIFLALYLLVQIRSLA